MRTFKSDISNLDFPINEKITGNSIRPSLMKLIQKEHPQFGEVSLLAMHELNHFREKYISNYLSQEISELTEIEKNVLINLTDHSTISDKLEEDERELTPTLGQKMADSVASFGGSWTFITIFGTFLLIWICINIFWFSNKGFDPYPFILLNLILSCLAAIQAPIIMMSQNRQEEKDRDRSKKDYIINLKSELEIRILHEKLDHLIIHQQQELIEIQKVQIDMMEDILKGIHKK